MAWRFAIRSTLTLTFVTGAAGVAETGAEFPLVPYEFDAETT